MARIIEHGAQVWTNYHKTFSCNVAQRMELANGDENSGRALLKAAAEEIQALLRRAKEEGVTVRPLGAGWSPSPINLVQQGWLVETRRLNRCFSLSAEHLAADRQGEAESLMLVQAGATVDEVYESAEELGRSLRTGGASNGQTIAGACATGTHGSAWQYGGLQDHIRAVQIVTPENVWWITPSGGLLSDRFVAETASELLADDDAFAAAQLNVGSLGFVSAMILETDPIFMVQNIQKAARIDPEHIAMLSNGNFHQFSAEFALDEEPYFLQLILNPFNPFGRKALLRFLYRRPYDASIPLPKPGAAGAGYDALTLLAEAMLSVDLLKEDVLQLAMEQAYPRNRDVDDPPAIATWGNTTEQHNPIANLFNGSVTMERSKLADAFGRILESFNEGGGGTVTTLRFVKKAAGLLAPARWDDNVVIDFDGPNLESAHRSYANVIARLDKASLEYTRHWGKTNNLDAARVALDYGDDYTRWRKAQQRIMPDPSDRQIFANEELMKLGLI